MKKYILTITLVLAAAVCCPAREPMSVAAGRSDIDGCTGATLSTRAVQANISAALEYYRKHKP